MIIADGDKGWSSQTTKQHFMSYKDLKKIHGLLVKLRPYVKTEEDIEAFCLIVKTFYDLFYCETDQLENYYQEKFTQLMDKTTFGK